MLIGYDFHLQGKRHKDADKAGQDYSMLHEITPSWKIAAVADGVSAATKSELASKIACEAVCKYIENAFPFDSFSNTVIDDDVEAVIRSSLHAAANEVERFADEKEFSHDMLDTTLVVALFNGQTAYLGLIGDSGIGLLKDDGQLLFSNPMNDEEGHVFPLRFRKAYKTARVRDVAAVFCMSDGIFKDHLLNYGEFDQRIADSYIPYQLMSESPLDSPEDFIQEFKKSIVYACESNSGLTDDLSVALLLNTNKSVKPKERKVPDLIQKIKAEISIYGVELQEKMFYERIAKLYPHLLDEQITQLFSGDISLESVLLESACNKQDVPQTTTENEQTNQTESAKAICESGEITICANNTAKSGVLQTAIIDAKDKVQGLFSKKDK